MKTVINAIAAESPALDEDSFRKAYDAAHPSPESLSDDNHRQAFCQYKGTVRRAKRRGAGIRLMKNVRHHPETLS